MTDRVSAEAHFGVLPKSAPDAIMLLDGLGRISLVNRRTEEPFGYQPGDLVGEKVELLVPDRLRAGHIARRAGYVADPRTREMGAALELHGRRSDGSEFPVEISLSQTQTGRDAPVSRSCAT